MKTKTVILWVIILVAIEQIIKLIIAQNYQDVNFEIIPSLVDFKPTLNNKTFYWLGLIDVNVDQIIRLGTGLIFLVVLAIFYLYLKKTIQNRKWVDITFIFGFAGILCSISDNIVFGGSWDYVYIKPLFIFDLKDIYLNCFSILFIVCFYQNRSEMFKIKTKDIIYSLKKNQNNEKTSDRLDD